MPTPATPLRAPVFHILLALAREDLHGLGIAAAVADATEGSVVLGPGTLYRSLKEMARDGLIEEVAAPAEVATPPTQPGHRMASRQRTSRPPPRSCRACR